MISPEKLLLPGFRDRFRKENAHTPGPGSFARPIRNQEPGPAGETNKTGLRSASIRLPGASDLSKMGIPPG